VSDDQFTELMAVVNATRESQERVEALVSKLAEEVKPTLETLMNNPAIKMILGLKKGK